VPRIRTIKPEFWHDEKLGRGSDHARLLFLAMISMADDAGRLLDNIKQVEAFVWPFSDADEFANHSRIIRESLDELAASGRIRRGVTASGQKIIEITHWARHQKVDKPNLKAALPEIVEAQHFSDSSNHSPNGSSNHSPNGSRPDLRPTTYDQRPTTYEPPAASADAPPARAPRAKPAPQYPHFPPDACNALYEAWQAKKGGMPYPRFRKALAPLFDVPGGRYPVDLLVRAIGVAKAVEGSHDRLRFLKPETFTENAAEWCRIAGLPVEQQMAYLRSDPPRRGVA
jgi:hypothetical protein